MQDATSRYQIDFSNHSCRIRIYGTKPGKQVRVLVKDRHNPAAPPLHGLGMLSESEPVFTATVASAEGEQTLVWNWPTLQAELGRFAEFD